MLGNEGFHHPDAPLVLNDLHADAARAQQILLAQENFARALALRPGGRIEVLDQFNAPRGESRISAALAADLDPAPGPEILLADGRSQTLFCLRRGEDGTYRPWHEVAIGELDLAGAAVADVGGSDAADLVLTAKDRIAVLLAGEADPSPGEIAHYESAVEDASLALLALGDVNGDGRTDIVAVDHAHAALEILEMAEEGISPQVRFRVFEEKRMTQAMVRNVGEPRELLVEDVTGDGRADLVLVVHDRILVYPQEAP